jgi:hypothetical protein
MLFDLRGRHRRRAVRVIYTGLALLMGVGLVGFGIGGGFGGGGLLSAAGENEGAGGSSYASQIKKYKKLVIQQPANVAAWEKLTSAQLHEAGNGETYVASNGQVTPKGKELYAATALSWERYLALNPPRPNIELAKRMVTVFDEEGLKQPAAAVQVLQLVVASEPKSAALYAKLAQYAYLAKNIRVGDLASAKAVSLAPAAQRARLKTELEATKKSPNGSVLTTTTNGKTYTGTTNSNGEFHGTEVTKTAPAGTSTTKTK